ncbi:RHS repeat-associated core domain-containing protein, partial [Pantoea sp. Cy-639]|uniref:RHS repeat domain-containing protein n=1 Tax=Pantoea sp. Cy-639 TaxID=2608360 RepID=UPI0019655939
AFEAIAWYHCDHLGTPMELTDEQGNIAWAGQYKAWGEVREERSTWAKQHGLGNPIRFQGQYHDHETELHYNRYRYYDSKVGRLIRQDPIGYAGGINVYLYAPNPVQWVDPLGLTCKCPCQGTFWADRSLPRDNHGHPTPDVVAPHTQLGRRDGRRGAYNQAREWGYENGNLVPIRDIDFTDHGRPQNHPCPHQHNWLPNPTGGTRQHGPAIPMEMP